MCRCWAGCELWMDTGLHQAVFYCGGANSVYLWMAESFHTVPQSSVHIGGYFVPTLHAHRK
jgi:hypothetical protein